MKEVSQEQILESLGNLYRFARRIRNTYLVSPLVSKHIDEAETIIEYFASKNTEPKINKS